MFRRLNVTGLDVFSFFAHAAAYMTRFIQYRDRLLDRDRPSENVLGIMVNKNTLFFQIWLFFSWQRNRTRFHWKIKSENRSRIEKRESSTNNQIGNDDTFSECQIIDSESPKPKHLLHPNPDVKFIFLTEYRNAYSLD